MTGGAPAELPFYSLFATRHSLLGPLPQPPPPEVGSRQNSREHAMTFAGVNYLAILIAAVVAWLAGAAWYMSLGRHWMSALGWTPEQVAECKNRPHSYLPFVYVFVAELIMAWTLAGLLGHI